MAAWATPSRPTPTSTSPTAGSRTPPSRTRWSARRSPCTRPGSPRPPRPRAGRGGVPTPGSARTIGDRGELTNVVMPLRPTDADGFAALARRGGRAGAADRAVPAAEPVPTPDLSAARAGPGRSPAADGSTAQARPRHRRSAASRSARSPTDGRARAGPADRGRGLPAAGHRAARRIATGSGSGTSTASRQPSAAAYEVHGMTLVDLRRRPAGRSRVAASAPPSPGRPRCASRTRPAVLRRERRRAAGLRADGLSRDRAVDRVAAPGQ